MTAKESRPTFRVFLSYTAEDLLAHAQVVHPVLRSHDMLGVDHRDWPSTGRPSVAECRERVAGCDALIVLVAHRYGWIPPVDEGGDGERSITWLEVQTAAEHELPVLALVLDQEASWPTKHVEGNGNPIAYERLDRFKAVLQKGLVNFFASLDGLKAATSVSLSALRERLETKREPRPIAPMESASDVVALYRRHLELATRHVEMIGFGEQFQVRLPIDQLYVPLRVDVPRNFGIEHHTGGPKALENAEHVLRDVPLEEAFRKAREFDARGVVLLGHPGSGKSTAARRLCWRAADPMQGSQTLGLPADVVPVLLSLRRVRPDTLAAGLGGLLRSHLTSLELSDGAHLSERLLERGRVLWILDGLDEVADEQVRETVSGSIAQAERARQDDWFLVTSRFAGYEKGARLKSGFLELHVQPLDQDQQAQFVSRWYATVERYVRGADARSASLAAERAARLTEILRGPDFRAARLASLVANPLLLSIVCIVHRKDVDLPKRRADLYAKCVDVLLESWRHEWRKEQGRGALDVGVARLVLEPLAWHLHEREKRDAEREELLPVVERALARVSGAIELERDPERFLEAIRCDSGLLVSAEPGRFEFLHLTFQEYLAARHAVGSVEPKDLARHYGEPWWNETTLLAAGLSTSERFMESFLEEVLKGTGFEEHGELSSFLVQEALLLPEEPFLERLRSGKTPAAKLSAILRLAPPTDAFVAAARKLTRHADGLVREAAARLLERAGVEVPSAARPEAGATIDERTGVAFVTIPAGKFSMGGKRHSDEHPPHPVRVESFLLARTPVTNAQYERYLKASRSSPPEHWSDRSFNQPEQPVVGVSWKDAQAYCRWAVFELPTEAEWEYACRAGTTTEYWSGDSEQDLARVGWFSGNAGGRLHVVAEKEASPFGLFDMHGNVWEWCQDSWSADYSKSRRVHPAAYESSGSPFRVLRGGSFRTPAGYARSASRGHAPTESRRGFLGFRPARRITTR